MQLVSTTVYSKQKMRCSKTKSLALAIKQLNVKGNPSVLWSGQLHSSTPYHQSTVAHSHSWWDMQSYKIHQAESDHVQCELGLSVRCPERLSFGSSGKSR